MGLCGAQRLSGALTSGYQSTSDDPAASLLLDRVASTTKVQGAELEQELADLAIDLLGSDALAVEARAGDESATEIGQWWYELLWSRALTIQGGTSQVQRNILAERVLGLPR